MKKRKFPLARMLLILGFILVVLSALAFRFESLPWNLKPGTVAYFCIAAGVIVYFLGRVLLFIKQIKVHRQSG